MLVLGVADVEEVEVDALVCSAELDRTHGVLPSTRFRGGGRVQRQKEVGKRKRDPRGENGGGGEGERGGS